MQHTETPSLCARGRDQQRLVEWILANCPDDITEGESATDTAIRWKGQVLMLRSAILCYRDARAELKRHLRTGHANEYAQAATAAFEAMLLCVEHLETNQLPPLPAEAVSRG